MTGLAVVEIASWDCIGKLAKQPVNIASPRQASRRRARLSQRRVQLIAIPDYLAEATQAARAKKVPPPDV